MGWGTAKQWANEQGSQSIGEAGGRIIVSDWEITSGSCYAIGVTIQLGYQAWSLAFVKPLCLVPVVCCLVCLRVSEVLTCVWFC